MTNASDLKEITVSNLVMKNVPMPKQ